MQKLGGGAFGTSGDTRMSHRISIAFVTVWAGLLSHTGSVCLRAIVLLFFVTDSNSPLRQCLERKLLVGRSVSRLDSAMTRSAGFLRDGTSFTDRARNGQTRPVVFIISGINKPKWHQSKTPIRFASVFKRIGRSCESPAERRYDHVRPETGCGSPQASRPACLSLQSLRYLYSCPGPSLSKSALTAFAPRSR